MQNSLLQRPPPRPGPERRRPEQRRPEQRSARPTARRSDALPNKQAALVSIENALQKSQSQGGASSPESSVAGQFMEQFADKARNPEAFHKLMSQVYGKNYDRKKAEGLRKRALRGDFAWLPKVKFLSNADISGANGAYDSETGTIFLNEKLADDPELAAATFSEEVGHHLDRELNETDTAGDEGEMFRRLLGGESLSQAQIQELRAENDKGTIRVDGQEVEVEFFLKKLKKKAKKAAKKIKNKVKKVAKKVGEGIKKAAKKVGEGIKKGLAKLAQNKWVGYALMAMQFIPATSAFAMMANAALAAYNAVKTGNIVGAVAAAAGAFTGAGGVVGNVANAVVRGTQVYEAARAAGKGQWTAAVAAAGAAFKSPTLTGAAQVAHGIKEKDAGLILSGAASVTGSQRLQQGAKLASAIQHKRPEEALAVLGQMSNNPRLTALANGVQGVRTKDVGMIVGAVEQLSPELRGAVVGQLDNLADSLPKEAGDALRREMDNRFKGSAQLLRAIGDKDAGAALEALGHISKNNRLKAAGNGIQAIENRDPRALLDAVSNLSPELRASAIAQLTKASEQLPPEVRDALAREAQSGFENTARFARAIEKGNATQAIGALGALSGSPRLQALGAGIEAIKKKDVSEVVDSLWKLSPELRNAAVQNLNNLAKTLPPDVAEQLRSEVKGRFKNTANLVRALERQDVSGALGALGRLSGSERLQAVGQGVDALQRKDIPELMRAIGTASPELQGVLRNKLDGIMAQLPPEVRDAWKQEKSQRFENVHALTNALANKRPAAAAEALLQLGGQDDAAAVLRGIKDGDPAAAVRALGDLSPRMREIAVAQILDVADRLTPQGRAMVRKQLEALLGTPLPATHGASSKSSAAGVRAPTPTAFSGASATRGLQSSAADQQTASNGFDPQTDRYPITSSTPTLSGEAKRHIADVLNGATEEGRIAWLDKLGPIDLAHYRDFGFPGAKEPKVAFDAAFQRILNGQNSTTIEFKKKGVEQKYEITVDPSAKTTEEKRASFVEAYAAAVVDFTNQFEDMQANSSSLKEWFSGRSKEDPASNYLAVIALSKGLDPKDPDDTAKLFEQLGGVHAFGSQHDPKLIKLFDAINAGVDPQNKKHWPADFWIKPGFDQMRRVD